MSDSARKPQPEIYADDLRKIVACLEPLEALSEALGEDWHVSGPVRIKNGQGWSHGFFTDTEFGWAFTPEYQEN